jgi:hydroxymethylglutaryl-CoA reductase
MTNYFQSKSARSSEETPNGTHQGSGPSIWAGFYKKTLQERRDQLRLVFPQLKPKKSLPLSVADNMIENCVGKFSVPLGLGVNFLINNKHYVVPMAVEEPSIIAAASGAAKTIAENGGFRAVASNNVMISQIQLLGLRNPYENAKRIVEHKEALISFANTLCRNMCRRGGGVKDIRLRILPWDSQTYLAVYNPNSENETFSHLRKNIYQSPTFVNFDPMNNNNNNEKYDHRNNSDYMLIVHIYVDVCESMGANLANTIAEGLAPKLADLIDARVGLKTVTNLSSERIARSEFEIPLERLTYKQINGVDVAKQIIEAYAMACEDPYRAVTHNKGIMNGIDAACLALGQDWRAIEAAAHVWATRTGRYLPLSHYRLIRNDSGQTLLQGVLEMPMPVGTKGGVIQSHPTLAYTHGLLGNPTSKQLAEILVSVGLAQNFAALRALTTEGIQRGHMSLHSRNIAIAAGAPPHLVAEVSAYMISREQIDVETAQDYLKAHQILRKSPQNQYKMAHSAPSTLFVKLELQGVTVYLNVVFETIGKTPIHLSLRDDANGSVVIPPVQKSLFDDKGPKWFHDRFASLKQVFCLKVTSPTPPRTNLQLQMKIKLLSIMINIVIHRLIILNYEKTETFIDSIITDDLNPLVGISENDTEDIRVGFPLVLALWQIFKHEVDASVGYRLLATALLEEQRRILTACVRSKKAIMNEVPFEEFMQSYTKRWQATMFLLIDLTAISPSLLTSDRLVFVLRLGVFFEWEGTIAHDVGRYERDTRKNIPNAYAYWLFLNKREHSLEAMQHFVHYAFSLNEPRKQSLLQSEEMTEFFDTKSFLRSVEELREFYELRRIQTRPHQLAKL